MAAAPPLLTPAAQAALAQAKAALQRRDIAAAERHALGALALAPQAPGVMRLLGMVRAAQGRFDEAATELTRALALDSADALTWNSLGNARGHLGDKAGAAQAFGEATRLAPTMAPFWFNLGKALAEDARPEDAVAALEQARRIAPERRTELLYAQNLRVAGRLADSAQVYRAVLGVDASCAEAWLGLANLKQERFSAADIAAMERAQRGPLGIDDAISIRFALARGYEDAQRFDDAWRAYADGNARVHALHPWDAGLFRTRVDEFLAADVPVARRAPAHLGHEAIFIVSLPRSGSSLTEQILASHAQIDGAGELHDLPAVLREESQRRGKPFPQWTADLGPDDWQRLGERYLARTARWRARKPTFTDKLPDNWRHVGAIAAMLPGARVIVCERDPVETALACFRQLFSRGGQAFSYDLADLAGYVADFQRASRHWLAAYPASVRLQRYEALQDDLDGEVHALLDFCALPFDPACLRFHETERAVRTASAGQVREPMRRDTARAPRYGVALDPLRDALRDAGVLPA